MSSSNYQFTPTLDGLNNIIGDSITCSTIDTVNARVENDLIVGNSVNITNDLTVEDKTTTNSLNVNNTAVGNRFDMSYCLIGPATYNAAYRLNINGTGIMGDRAYTNSGSRVFNIRDTNGLMSIGRYSGAAPGFEMRNYNATTNALVQDVLFLGPPSWGENWSVMYRSPGLGDFTGFYGTRSLFDFYTPIRTNGDLRFATGIGKIDQSLSTGTNTLHEVEMKANTDITFLAGTGRINQNLSTGTNNFSPITMNTDCGILFNSGSGSITQNNDGINTLAETRLSGNKDLVFNTGTGRINQTNSTGLNIVNGLSIKLGQDITMSGSGKITQGTGINQLSTILMNTGANLTLQGAGVLAIPSYPNVKTTLDTLTTDLSTLATNTTGITYDNVNDDTVIDNNVVLGNNKTLYTQNIIQGTGGSNTMNSITMSSATTSYIQHQDGTQNTSKYSEETVRDTDILGFMVGKNILTSTFNLGNATNTSVVGITVGVNYLVAVRVIKGQTYTGVGFYVGTGGGTWNCALYDSGLQPARRAITTGAITTSNAMNFQNFTAPYVATSTRVMYVGYRTTTSAPVQTALHLPSNALLNWGYNTMTNSTFNKRCQNYSLAGDFPNPIPAGLAMTNQLLLGYIVLYS